MADKKGLVERIKESICPFAKEIGIPGLKEICAQTERIQTGVGKSPFNFPDDILDDGKNPEPKIVK